MIDYDKIIEDLDIEKVKNILDNLKINYRETDTYLLLPTVCHNIDSETASEKLYFYKDNKFFYCYTECGGFSIFKFLEKYYTIRDIDYNWYEDIYKVILGASNTTNYVQGGFPKIDLSRYTQNEEICLPTYNETVLNTFIKYYPVEWLNEGITKETMDKFNIKYSITQNKIVIPHYNIDNELVGIRGRALNDWEVEAVGKYLPMKIEQTWYSHPLSLNLYGLNINKENIKKNKIAFLFEGEKSPLIFENFKRDNCAVAVCGSHINIHQIKLLIKNCDVSEIVVCFDKEELPNEKQYFNKLWNMCKKYKNYCNMSFIYDTKNLLELKDSPVDKGEEVFEELLKYRIKVR